MAHEAMTTIGLVNLIAKHDEDFKAFHQKMRPDDIIVFGDLTRDDVVQMAVQQLGWPAVTAIREKAAEESAPPMVVLGQPARFLEMLANDGEESHRLTADELRVTSNGRRQGGILAHIHPVLLLLPGKIKSTKWSSAPDVAVLDCFEVEA